MPGACHSRRQDCVNSLLIEIDPASSLLRRGPRRRCHALAESQFLRVFPICIQLSIVAWGFDELSTERQRVPLGQLASRHRARDGRPIKLHLSLLGTVALHRSTQEPSAYLHDAMRRTLTRKNLGILATGRGRLAGQDDGPPTGLPGHRQRGQAGQRRGCCPGVIMACPPQHSCHIPPSALDFDHTGAQLSIEHHSEGMDPLLRLSSVTIPCEQAIVSNHPHRTTLPHQTADAPPGYLMRSATNSS